MLFPLLSLLSPSLLRLSLETEFVLYNCAGSLRCFAWNLPDENYYTFGESKAAFELKWMLTASMFFLLLVDLRGFYARCVSLLPLSLSIWPLDWFSTESLCYWDSSKAFTLGCLETDGYLMSSTTAVAASWAFLMNFVWSKF